MITKYDLEKIELAMKEMLIKGLKIKVETVQGHIQVTLELNGQVISHDKVKI